MKASNAIEWHTKIADDFDHKYSNSNNFKERYSIWTSILNKYSSENHYVIDMGCGSGIFSFYLADKNKNVLGLDASHEMLKICQRKKENDLINNVEFMSVDISIIDNVMLEKADMLISSSVLEYLDDFDKALVNVKSILKDKGLFIFSVPNKNSLYRKLERVSFQYFDKPEYYRYLKHLFTYNEIEKRIKQVGFEIIENTYYGKTPILSELFRLLGISKYSDNLFVVVARLL